MGTVHHGTYWVSHRGIPDVAETGRLRNLESASRSCCSVAPAAAGPQDRTCSFKICSPGKHRHGCNIAVLPCCCAAVPFFFFAAAPLCRFLASMIDCDVQLQLAIPSTHSPIHAIHSDRLLESSPPALVSRLLPSTRIPGSSRRHD